MKSRQWAQKVGWRKIVAINLCPFTWWTMRRIAPRRWRPTNAPDFSRKTYIFYIKNYFIYFFLSFCFIGQLCNFYRHLYAFIKLPLLLLPPAPPLPQYTYVLFYYFVLHCKEKLRLTNGIQDGSRIFLFFCNHQSFIVAQLSKNSFWIIWRLVKSALQ